MAGLQTVEITTDGRLVQVAMFKAGKHAIHAIHATAMAITPEEAEAIGNRLIEVARIARLVGGVNG